MSLLKMSFSGSMIILAIIIIRSLLIYKLPKRLLLVFWDMAIIRLLIPFSIPTVLSVYSLIQQASMVFERKDVVVGVSNGTFDSNAKEWSLNMFTSNLSSVPVPETSSTLFPRVWNIVWVIGLIIVSIMFMVAYFRWYKEFKKSIPIRNEFLNKWLLEHKLKRQIEIRYSDRISAPLSYGILKPVILMPKNTNWEDEENLKYVLAHEYIHIRNYDVAMKLLLIVTVCVHWFNPFVWFMYILANRDIELICDETVINMFGRKTRKAYVMMLMRMEEAKNAFAPMTNSFSRNAIEVRIDAIIKMKNFSVRTVMFAVVIMLGIMILFASSAKASSERDVEQEKDFTFPISDINSRYVQERLYAEGIDTNSAQYRGAVKGMLEAANEEWAQYENTSVIIIKNIMKDYDEDGDFINPVSGIALPTLTEDNLDEKNRIIPIPESIREEMFELKRMEFIRENGIANGDTTNRSDVYNHLYLQIEKEDRPAAGYTLNEYENMYNIVFFETLCENYPGWQIGNEIPENALANITRESVESQFVQVGNSLVKESVKNAK